MLSILPSSEVNFVIQFLSPFKPANSAALHTRTIEKAPWAGLHIWILWKQVSPSGEFLLKRRSRTRPRPQRPIQDGGRKTSLLPTFCPRCSHYHSRCNFTASPADRREQPYFIEGRCQVGTKVTDWLVNVFTLALFTRLTVSTSVLRGFPWCQFHQYQTIPQYWVKVGGSGGVCGCCGAVVGALPVLSDMIWSAIVVLPLKGLDRKSVSQCIYQWLAGL